MDKIELAGLEYFCYHGCLPEERQQGQKFLVDVKLYLDLKKAGNSDNLTATVNYAEVYEDIKKIVTGEPYNLIEAVAEKIAAVILAKYAAVKKLKVTVHKPSAPIAGKFRDVAVSLRRKRG